MSESENRRSPYQTVGEQHYLMLGDFCHACHVPEEHVIAWVFEGILDPLGNMPKDWKFPEPSLTVAKKASRLTFDLELNPPGVALVLDLLAQIGELQVRLKVLSGMTTGPDGAA